MFNFEEELKMLPEKPGVYIMKDSDDNIIYIGKAVILKNRVRQYFQASTNKSVKTQVMTENVASFEYIVTDSELEALILECTLIKKHKPKFNIMLKDDKNFYPYIKVTVQNEYPDILMVRKVEDDGALYFGPYPSASTVNETISMIRKLFAVKSCKKQFPRDIGKERPCLNYHIGNCVGVCKGDISSEEYRKLIDEVIAFLKGDHGDIKANLKEQMEDASSKMQYEKAADYRDKIEVLKDIEERQKIISMDKKDEDYIAFVKDDSHVWIQVFFVREGKLIGRDGYMFDIISDTSDADIMEQFLKQFYSSSITIPPDIYLSCDIAEKDILEEWLTSLRGKRVRLNIPQRGEKAWMINSVKQNAVIAMDKYLKSNYRRKIENKECILKLKNMLDLSKVPERIEAYDISNTGSSDIVGSMIVFAEGVPAKSEYRKFKIKGQNQQNDYLAMEEMLTRRFNRLKDDENFSKKPDIVLMDGGAGHVSVAEKVLADKGLDIPVAGMVKDMNHNTRALLYNGIEYDIKEDAKLFKFIVSIQDEAHRVAITYNRKVREKRYRKSELDNIDGIGPKKKKALIKHFGSVAAIKRVEIDDLEAVEGISSDLAKKIYNYFH